MTTIDDVVRQIEELQVALRERDLTPHELEEISAELTRLKERIGVRGEDLEGLRALKGLGKEIWRSIDVDEYIRKERHSWR